ncbi:hypothetical protein OS493_036299 [Desmophyllum pertusum]|uniref:Uncharacterized protein n=1 Tax=Desmophyllum pertusum TaxID=174260 RepID=A0A9X0CUM0_9CNID|nr:hypothetical protein OS493_036299 [Desmophyllum pertusum]
MSQRSLFAMRQAHCSAEDDNFKEFLTVPLTRKYGSMPSLAQKSVISLEYKDGGFKPRRVSGSSDHKRLGTRKAKCN